MAGATCLAGQALVGALLDVPDLVLRPAGSRSVGRSLRRVSGRRGAVIGGRGDLDPSDHVVASTAERMTLVTSAGRVMSDR